MHHCCIYGLFLLDRLKQISMTYIIDHVNRTQNEIWAQHKKVIIHLLKQEVEKPDYIMQMKLTTVAMCQLQYCETNFKVHYLPFSLP